jgi:hypothetical protein
MLGIHTVWTGTDRRGTPKIHDMMAFESLTMILSCLYWKRFQGKIKLYCDQPFYDYINDLGLTSLWDEIDTTTLSEGLSDDINTDTFWAYCKMYVNSLQTEPFVSLDIDLFQDRPYDYTTHDLVFSHIETSDYGNGEIPPHHIFYYPNYHEWEMFKERFEKFPNIKVNTMAFNVAVLAINNLDVIKDLMGVVNSFVKGNNFDPQDITTHGHEKIMYTIHSSSLMTFVEQRLLAAVAESNKYTWKHVLNLIYSGEKQGWLGDMNEMINPGITHLWGWKTQYRLKEYENDRHNLTEGLLDQLRNKFPNDYNKYVTLNNLLNKCKK